MPDHGNRAVVFVVDDEPNIARTAALILCSDGHDARAFTDPLTALQAARIEAPNLLLTDVIMPGLNGFQLVAGVVESCPQCRALLFSGNPSARENYASSAAEKTLEMLLKPVPPLDLLHAVRRTLDA